VGERLVDEWFVVFECYPYGGYLVIDLVGGG